MEIVHQFLVVFMAFFAMMNPLSGLPVFAGLTADDDPATARAVGTKALLIAFCVVVVFAVGGKVIFELFGITLPALRIAGGALVFLVGFHMVQGKHSPVQHPPTADADTAHVQALNVAVSPLAVPLLAGPGTIATAMNFAAQGGFVGVATTIAAFAVLCAITWLLFRYSGSLLKALGENTLNVITRLMGLILAVIGVQLLIVGLKAAFPSLG